MDIFSKEKRSDTMRKIKSKGTGPELAVRKLLFGSGYRYTLHAKVLPGNPDIVFSKRRKVIFVHGCFWHQHEGCKVARKPKSNEEYWLPKLESNVRRDAKNFLALQQLGWAVKVVWECEVKNDKKLMAELRSFLDGE